MEAHPLASDDFYPGDVLAAVAWLPDGFWSAHRPLIARAIRAIDAALARVHKVDMVEELPDELRAARARLAALHGGPAAA